MMGRTCDLTLQKTDNNTKKSAATCTDFTASTSAARLSLWAWQ